MCKLADCLTQFKLNTNFHYIQANFPISRPIVQCNKKMLISPHYKCWCGVQCVKLSDKINNIAWGYRDYILSVASIAFDSEMIWYEYSRMLSKGQFCFKPALRTLNFYKFPSLQRTLVQCNKNSIISIS